MRQGKDANNRGKPGNEGSSRKSVSVGGLGTEGKKLFGDI